MIADFFLNLLASMVEGVVSLLPGGEPVRIPGLSSVWDAVAGLDQVVPILGPLTAGLGLLSAGVVFVAIRLVLTVWNLIYP